MSERVWSVYGDAAYPECSCCGLPLAQHPCPRPSLRLRAEDRLRAAWPLLSAVIAGCVLGAAVSLPIIWAVVAGS